MTLTTALQKNQELTFSDEEIDAFLPIELRKLKSEGKSTIENVAPSNKTDKMGGISE